MKTCKYCQEEINEKAKICPRCGKKQGKKKWVMDNIGCCSNIFHNGRK